MNRAQFTMGALTLLSVCAVGGCGSTRDETTPLEVDEQLVRTYTEVLGEQLAAREEMNAMLKTVQDGPSMKVALAALKRLETRVEEIARRSRKLPSPSDAVRKRIDEQIGPRRAEAFNGTLEEVRRIQALPGGNDFFAEVNKLKSLGPEQP